MGRRTSSPPSGVSARPRSSARSRTGSTSIALSSHPRVLEAERQLGGTLAGRDEPVERRRAAARSRRPRSTRRRGRRRSRRSVRSLRGCGGPPSTSVRTTSFAPAGFLTSSSRSACRPAAMRSKRPKAAPKRPSPATISSSGRAERVRERRRAEGVVDVVETGQRELDASRPAGEHEVEGDPLEPVQLEVAGDDVERRPRVAAGGAAVVAEMADVGGGVVVRGPAADAVLRVGRVLERRVERRAGRRGRRRSGCAPSEVADLRVVARSATSAVPSGSAATASRQRSATSSSSPYRSSWSRKRFPRHDGARADPAHHLRQRPPRRPRADPSSASPAASRVEATPERRFAPERLCASRNRGRRISAAIAAVVVFPFVAETTAVPAGSRAASRSTAPGSRIESELPRQGRPAAGAREARERAHGRARRRSRERARRPRGRIYRCADSLAVSPT